MKKNSVKQWMPVYFRQYTHGMPHFGYVLSTKTVAWNAAEENFYFSETETDKWGVEVKTTRVPILAQGPSGDVYITAKRPQSLHPVTDSFVKNFSERMQRQMQSDRLELERQLNVKRCVGKLRTLGLNASSNLDEDGLEYEEEEGEEADSLAKYEVIVSQASGWSKKDGRILYPAIVQMDYDKFLALIEGLKSGASA